MYMKSLRYITLMLVLVLGCACTKEVNFVTNRPQSYLDLVSAYRDEAVFVETETTADGSIVRFDDREISVPASDFVIHDCSNTNHPPLVLIPGEGWLISGKQTHIPGTKGQNAEDSYPVYVYLYDETLHIFASNDETLSFATKEKFIAKDFTMPRVYITHNSDRIHKSYAIDAEIKIEDPDCHYSDIQTISSTTRLQGRGNSTWDFPKKPFKIKLSQQAKVLDMPANKDWVFIANYSDKSLLRNALAMKCSKILEMPWTPRYRIVEVWINGEYQGVYNLFEKKEVTRNKVNINLSAGDIYLEIEQNIDCDYYFTTNRCRVPVQFKEPDIPSTEVFQSTEKLFRDFETALYSSNFKDPNKGYAAYIDVASFIDNYIIRELAKDVDGNVRKSSFLTVEKNIGKIRFYHVWDFDLSFGNCDYFPWDMSGCQGNPNGPYGWWIKDYNTDSYKGNSWYNRLFQDPAFVSALQDRWAEVYPELARMPEYIGMLVKEMGDAPKRNFDKWQILGSYVWPNVVYYDTYEKEVEYLIEFYTKRLEWLDQNIYKL